MPNLPKFESGQLVRVARYLTDAVPESTPKIGERYTVDRVSKCESELGIMYVLHGTSILMYEDELETGIRIGDNYLAQV